MNSVICKQSGGNNPGRKSKTARKESQCSMNDNQKTFRQHSSNKFSDKSATHHQINAKKGEEKLSHNRDPEMIKLMIEQLQKELQSKQTPKLSKTVKAKNTIFNKDLQETKPLFYGKNKRLVIANSQNCSQDVSKNFQKINKPETVSAKINSKKSKRKQIKSPQHYHLKQAALKTNKPSSKNKSISNREFVFLGENLVQISSGVPLFTLENNPSFVQTCNLSDQTLPLKSKHSNRRDSCQQEKVSFGQTHNFIERCDISQDLEVRNKNDNNDQEFVNQQVQAFEEQFEYLLKNCSNKKVSASQRSPQLELSCVRIQRWWRKVQSKRAHELESQKLQQRLSVETQKKYQRVVIPTQTNVSPKRIESKHYESDVRKADQLINSKSDKVIPQANENHEKTHEDILKLRQSAAHLQFNTHQKILEELRNKNKITPEDFSEKSLWIERNLSRELEEIKGIRTILKDSAKKVESIMQKAKENIKIVKEMQVEEQEQWPFTEQQTNSIEENRNLLKKIFGEETPVGRDSNKSSYRSIKTEHFKKQLEDFATHRSEQSSDNDHSFDACSDNHKNIRKASIRQNSSKSATKIYNSPRNSQEQITSEADEDSCSERVCFDDEDEFQQHLPQTYESSSSPGKIREEQIQVQNISDTENTANFEQLYKEYQHQQELKREIDMRIAKQLGMTDEYLTVSNEAKVGINTSIVGIHKFLLNFFKFYLYYHKESFLKLMNMPYGEAVETRLQKNKLKENRNFALEDWREAHFLVEDDQEVVYGLKNVIPQSVLEDFFNSYYEETDIQFTENEKTNIHLEKIHNQAVFDSFNAEMNAFRPYFSVKGPPYLWCNSEKSLTFFFIGQENIQQVYDKTQMKILRFGSSLCGLTLSAPQRSVVSYKKETHSEFQITSPFKIIEKLTNEPEKKLQGSEISSFADYLQAYTSNFSPVYYANLEERLIKKETVQTEEENAEWYSNSFEEQKVSTLLNLNELVEEIIFAEQCREIQSILNQATAA